MAHAAAASHVRVIRMDVAAVENVAAWSASLDGKLMVGMAKVGKGNGIVLGAEKLRVCADKR